MSNSWGNAIWLDDEPNDIYAKVMAVVDDLIINYLTLATDVSMAEIGEYEKKLKSGENPINIKKELAHQIVKELHNENAANNAQNTFEHVVQNKEKPDPMKTINMLASGMSLSEILRNEHIFESNSQIKGLVDQNGIRLNNQIVDDEKMIVPEGENEIQIGKNKLIKIIIKK
jgi:tyrosyl-tRNA synthetase